MNPKQEAVMRIVQNIYAVQEDVIQCDAAELLMMQSAETLATDEESQARFPTLWHHFQLCLDCYQEYRLLVEFVQAETARQQTEAIVEQSGQATISSTLLTNVRKLWTQFQDAIRIDFPGFQLVDAAALRGRASVAPVELDLIDGKLMLSLALYPSDQNPALQTLELEFDPHDATAAEQLEQATIQLLVEATGAVEREEPIDDGQVIFDEIPSQVYALYLQLGDDTYLIHSIDANILED